LVFLSEKARSREQRVVPIKNYYVLDVFGLGNWRQPDIFVGELAEVNHAHVARIPRNEFDLRFGQLTLPFFFSV
jgi:hypothetical protein